jgi:hypothetical protein
MINAYLYFMKLERQIQFTRMIRANGQLKEFNFLKIKNATVPTYHVDVSDERGNRHYFSLIREESGWIIAKSTLPAWVTEVQNDIASAVSQYEAV